MINKGLTLSIIFEANACTGGEGFGNMSVLKKMPIAGQSHTYISRNSYKYSLYNMMNWDDTPVVAQGSGDKKVVQYDPKENIKTSKEMDLRGYMLTETGNSATTRSAVARISDFISLEPYRGDTDFINNMGMSRRVKEKINNNLANVEIHHSMFQGTISDDLDRVGVDGEIELSNEERCNRVLEQLTGIEYLRREWRGDTENLMPVFVIGGVYDIKNPFFKNRIKYDSQGNLNIQLLKDTIENAGIAEDTVIGSLGGVFKNDAEVREFAPLSIHETFERLRKAVIEVYK